MSVECDSDDSKVQISLNENLNKAKKCTNCGVGKRKEFYSAKQWKSRRSTGKCKTCTQVNSKLPKSSSKEHDTILSVDSCKGLNAVKISNKFKKKTQVKNQVKNQVRSVEVNSNDAKVQNCPHNNMKECSCCKLALSEDTFSSRQWNVVGVSRRCKICILKQLPVKEQKADEIDEDTKKKMLKMRPTLVPNSEKNIFQFLWPSYPISKQEEKYAASVLIKKGNYGPLDEKEKQVVIVLMKSTQITLGQALSLRSTLLQQKALFKHINIQSSSTILLKMYNSGHSVVEISKQFDFPPMNTFRSILSEASLSKGLIKKCFKDPKEYFEDRECNELLAAEAADLVAKADDAQNRKEGEGFEDLLANWFQKRGIRHVRQSELEKEQKKDFGSPVLTPDFLFLDHLVINGTKVTWMDCKAFYGANVGFTVKNMKKQMARYINHWGSGAVLYLHGYSDSLHIHDCVFLDAKGALDVDEISRLVCVEPIRNDTSTSEYN